jgi:transposase
VALVDALGNLAHFLLLPWQCHDSVGADPLLDGIEIGALIADKGFDTDALHQELDACGATAVILPKANRARPIACDFAMYRWRHLVEMV